MSEPKKYTSFEHVPVSLQRELLYQAIELTERPATRANQPDYCISEVLAPGEQPDISTFFEYDTPLELLGVFSESQDLRYYASSGYGYIYRRINMIPDTERLSGNARTLLQQRINHSISLGMSALSQHTTFIQQIPTENIDRAVRSVDRGNNVALLAGMQVRVNQSGELKPFLVYKKKELESVALMIRSGIGIHKNNDFSNWEHINGIRRIMNPNRADTQEVACLAAKILLQKAQKESPEVIGNL